MRLVNIIVTQNTKIRRINILKTENIEQIFVNKLKLTWD